MKFYTGNPNNRPKTVHPDSPKREPYLATDELVTAVNLAIFLKRPLLLEGEAGCGKTRLASAVAYELGYPLYRWNIRSKTRYQEGLYDYDALLRLHDVNLIQKLDVQSEERERKIDPSNVENYLDLKELGKAFKLDECPAVVLIDEIDKADLDFPNDLLTVLEAPYEFTIRETGETITAKHPPIVIITSNKEKGNLPAPFLRRCVYHFIEFPDKPEQLEKIVNIHFRQDNSDSEVTPVSDELVETAIQQFLGIRQQKGLSKLPGTSEFLDWLRVLVNFGEQPYSVEALKTQAGPLPYRELLFKLRSDWQQARFSASL
ncbi:MAG: MoxR family ATPase [Cyanothece sp. SIO1E1]|nr:MoxR family ATPase [Cyanothece sp. SIO1E1]